MMLYRSTFYQPVFHATHGQQYQSESEERAAFLLEAFKTLREDHLFSCNTPLQEVSYSFYL